MAGADVASDARERRHHRIPTGYGDCDGGESRSGKDSQHRRSRATTEPRRLMGYDARDQFSLCLIRRSHSQPRRRNVAHILRFDVGP
jgi:hypothetical protein